MTHARMHVCFGAFDVIVEVVAEELYVGDGCSSDDAIVKMTGEKDEGNISNIVGVPKTRNVANFEGWVTVRVKDLRRVLDSRLPSCVDEFLVGGIHATIQCLWFK